MNKFFTKIAGSVLSLAMAVGVGVGVAVNSREMTPTYATEETKTISYTDFSGGTSGSGSEMKNTIDPFTITFSIGYRDTSKTYAQSYANGSIQFVGNDLVTITSVVITATSSSYNGAQKGGSWSITSGDGSVSASDDTITYSNGNSSSLTLTHTKQLRWTTMTITYATNTSVPSVSISSCPAYLVDGGTPASIVGTIENDNNYTITWSANPSTGVTFNPSTSSSGKNVNISFDGVTTGTTPIVITAKINDGNDTSAQCNIYALEHSGTSDDPFTATDANVFANTNYAAQKGGDWYVGGYVVGTYSTNKGYYIDEDPSATSEPYKFEVFNSNGVTNSTGKEIIVGASYIVAHGSMTYYASGSISEITGATITSVDNGSIPGIVINEGDQSIFLGDSLTLTATTDNPDNAVVTWSSSDTNVATINSNTGTVTTVGVGTTTITASMTVESQEYTASVTLEVSIFLLKAGDAVIFYYDTNYLTDINTVGSTPYGNQTTTKSEAFIYTVETGSSKNSFAFSNNGNYLSWSSGNSLKYTKSVSSESSWIITGTSLTNCTISNVETNTRIMKYNSSATRFACYTSGQNAVSIEKVVVADPTILTLDTKTLTLEVEEVASSALTFTTDSPNSLFTWFSEDTTKATVSNGVVTAGTHTGVTVKIYVYFDKDGSGDFDPSKDLYDFCSVSIVPPTVDYSSVTYGGIGSKITAENKSKLLANGKKIIMTYNDTEVAGEYGSYINATTSSVTFDTANKKVTIGDGTTEITDLTILTLETSTNGFYLKTKDGQYLSNTSTDTKAGNFAKIAETESTKTEWIVSESGIYDFSKESTATIMVNTATTPHRFKPYQSTLSSGKPVVVYSFEEYTDEAETYAELFLESGLCGINDNTKAKSEDWLILKDLFDNNLSLGAQYILKTAISKQDSDNAIQKCLARYDRVIYLHYNSESLAYPDFMNRVSGGYVTPKFSSNNNIFGNVDSNNSKAIIVLLSFACSSVIGCYFFMRNRKKKEQ